jgi:hypothetical protein
MKSSEIDVARCAFNTLVIDSENGNVRVTSDGTLPRSTTSYDLSASEGLLVYNGTPYEDGSYKISQAISRATVKITVAGGNINLTDDDT